MLDFDFTAQTLQMLSPNATYTFGGFNWIKVESANEPTSNVSDSFVQPLVGSTVTTITANDTEYAVGSYVKLTPGGIYIVTATTGSNITIRNTGFAGNALPGTLVSGTPILGAAQCAVGPAVNEYLGGLSFVPRTLSNSDYGQGTMSVPSLWLSFAQIAGLAGMTWDSALRIWAWVSSDTLATGGTNVQGELLAIDDNNGVGTGGPPPNNNAFVIKRWINAGAGQAQCALSGNGAYVATQQPMTLGASNVTMMLEIQNLSTFNVRAMYGTAPVAGVWPAYNSLVPFLNKNYDPTTQLVWRTTGSPAPGSFGIRLGGIANGAAATAVPLVNFSRLRVDVLI